MNFALLGDDPAALPLLEAVHQSGHKVVRAALAETLRSRSAVIALLTQSRWEDILIDAAVEAVIVAGDTIVAGSLNVQKGDRLYGRYWGCKGDERFVHFEVCYHRAIDWCIANGLTVFEPGHGGDHKFKRGFLPEVTWSAHALSHAGLHRGLAEWSQREAEAVHADVASLRAASPLRIA